MSLLVCLILIYYVSFVRTDDIEGESVSEAVVTLTDANFTSFLKENERVLIEFYAPWCGHCKALAPEYEAAAQQLNDENAITKLAKVDATENRGSTENFDVQGYPTVVYVEKDKKPVKYELGRTKDAIVNWVKDKEIPAFTLVAYDTFKKMNNDDYVDDEENQYMLFAFVRKGSKKDKLFDAFAESIKGKTVGMTLYKVYIKKPQKFKVELWRNNRKLFKDENIDGDYKVSFNGRIAPKKKDKRFEISDLDLGNWLHMHRYPFFINGTEAANVLQLFDQSQKTPKKGLIIVRVDDDSEDEFKSKSIDIVKELRIEGYYTVLTKVDYDNIDFNDLTTMMVLQKRLFDVAKFKNPAYLAPQQQTNEPPKEYIPAGQQMRLYKFRSDNDVTLDNFKSFINDVKNDKIERYMKSREIPEESNTNIIQVVGKTFNDVVLDKEYDVLMLFCAKWNQNCQTFQPIYNKLSQHIKQYYSDKGKVIKLAQIELDGNDIDELRIVGVPTLILYPKGSNVLTDGIIVQDREFDSLIEFIDENAQILKQEL